MSTTLFVKKEKKRSKSVLWGENQDLGGDESGHQSAYNHFLNTADGVSLFAVNDASDALFSSVVTAESNGNDQVRRLFKYHITEETNDTVKGIAHRLSDLMKNVKPPCEYYSGFLTVLQRITLFLM